MQVFVHYFLHLIFPFFIAFIFFRKEWKKAYLILLATMLVDFDHLLASPVFEANRCSINFHPMHTYYAMIVYAMLLFFRKPYKIIGIGLLFHMLTDLIDCLWMYENCKACFTDSPAYGLLNGISKIWALNTIFFKSLPL